MHVRLIMQIMGLFTFDGVLFLLYLLYIISIKTYVLKMCGLLQNKHSYFKYHGEVFYIDRA